MDLLNVATQAAYCPFARLISTSVGLLVEITKGMIVLQIIHCLMQQLISPDDFLEKGIGWFFLVNHEVDDNRRISKNPYWFYSQFA